MVSQLPITRRGWLAGCATLALPRRVRAAVPVRQRSIVGAYLVRPGAGDAGVAASAMFARWGPALALAMHGHELLLADGDALRVWRVDSARQTMRGVAGAPVAPGLLLALGPDGSAWVLDASAHQLLRFAPDGRLLQTLRLPRELVTPQALVLADAGATLLLADGVGAQWVELGGRAPAVRWVQPRRPDSRAVGSVDALAVRGDALYLLDRHYGVVWEAGRDGRVGGPIGHGELLQPRALAVDADGQLIVHDAGDACLKLLRSGTVVARLDADALGVAEIGPMACDGGLLGVADARDGPVTLYRLGAGSR